MPTRKQFHQEVDAVPEDLLDNAQVVVLESEIESLGREGGAGASNGAVQLNGLVNPIDDPWKDCVPFQGDVSDLVSLTHDPTDEQREQQRAHWRKVREELKAEGADGSRYLPQLEAEADLEDAQAASSTE
jgi:hypothetical protein